MTNYVCMYVRGVIKREPLFSNFVSYAGSIFTFFPVILAYCLLQMYVANINHFRLSACVGQIRRLVGFWLGSSIFYYSKEWIKEPVLSFV